MATEIPSNLIRAKENIFLDPMCLSAQDQVQSFSLTTSFQYGKVDLTLARAENATVGAGTITQTTAGIGIAGSATKLAGVTLSSTSGTTNLAVDAPRVPSVIAKQFKNKTMSFQCKVKHDFGSDTDFRIVLVKPNTADTFSGASTTISTSVDQAVSNDTETVIKSEGVSIGDISNGLLMRVQVESGDITTKNLEVTDFSGVIGEKSVDVTPYDLHSHINQIKRRLQFYNYDQSTGNEPIINGRCNDTNTVIGVFNFPEMDLHPSSGIAISSTNSGSFLAIGPVSSAAGSSNTKTLTGRQSFQFTVNTAGTPFTQGHGGQISRNGSQTCWIKLDSRL